MPEQKVFPDMVTKNPAELMPGDLGLTLAADGISSNVFFVVSHANPDGSNERLTAHLGDRNALSESRNTRLPHLVFQCEWRFRIQLSSPAPAITFAPQNVKPGGCLIREEGAVLKLNVADDPFGRIEFIDLKKMERKSRNPAAEGDCFMADWWIELWDSDNGTWVPLSVAQNVQGAPDARS